MQKYKARKLLSQVEAVAAGLLKQAESLKEIIAAPVKTIHPGPLPFGKNDKEREIIERVMELRNAGKIYSEIVAVLNREGYKTRRGKKWHIAGVQRIFVNQEERAA